MSQPTNFRTVGQTMRKKDSMQLLLGKGVYTDDIVRSRSPLVVKLLRSPHANAIVQSIRTDIAKKVPGVVDVYTWEDVPQKRFAIAGQTFPEPSPYDRLILDRHVRFVGDAVAIVAAEDEKAAQKALKLIKVEYQVLEPLLDFRTAKQRSLIQPHLKGQPGAGAPGGGLVPALQRGRRQQAQSGGQRAGAGR